MRHRVATPLFAARIPSTTSAPRIIYTQQRTTLRRSSSFSSTTLEKIAKSIYREILRECAGKQRARSKVAAVNALSPHLNLPPSSSSSSPTTKETNTKGAIPFRVRALLANNLREAFRAARDDDEAKTKVNENEKIANLARTISIWTFCHRANEDNKSTEYVVLNNLVSYYDSRAKIHSRLSSKKILRDRKILASLETEFNTLCVKPLIEHIERSASVPPKSSSSTLRPPFVFNI
jgi:hypothetical protein